MLNNLILQFYIARMSMYVCVLVHACVIYKCINMCIYVTCIIVIHYILYAYLYIKMLHQIAPVHYLYLSKKTDHIYRLIM